MTLDEAVAAFEGGMVVSNQIGFSLRKQKKSWAFAPTGERYVTVTSGGVKEEGESFEWYCTTEDQAVTDWLVSARAYAASVGGNALFWRERPQLERNGFRFGVYSRLVISQKQMLKAA